MYHIRRISTSSGKTAIQVVKYKNRKRIIVKHIGSASIEPEIEKLSKKADKFIESLTKQQSIEETIYNDNQIENYDYVGIKHNFSYQILETLYQQMDFGIIDNEILKDLIIIRIFEPASKTKSLELLNKYFEISYKKSSVFDVLKTLYKEKETAEKKAIYFAKHNYGFQFKVIFYDVTTLYFEAFKEDELRKCGFSKDHKFNQPQILVALIVTDNGFPIGYEIFRGNKFEGHTILPSITKLRKKHQIDNLTVVADAAMISQENVQNLKENNFTYIVGARLGNLSNNLIKDISTKLKRINNNTCRISTKLGDLICHFSKNRFHKDKSDMTKQLKRAQAQINKPDKTAKLYKFVKKIGKVEYAINEELRGKTELLLGIKGYYTNLKLQNNDSIINQYHNLWKIEKSFRIAKSDLQIRPIYHYKETGIKSHILICFMALCITKHIELRTNLSISKFLNHIKSIADATLISRYTGNKKILKMVVPIEITNLLRKLAVSH